MESWLMQPVLFFNKLRLTIRFNGIVNPWNYSFKLIFTDTQAF